MPQVMKNGKLVEVSEEEARSLQEKAQASGMPNVPVTPVGAAGAGATEDQAKMAGTKAQKQNVLGVDQAPDTTLTSEDRLAGPREQTSSAEDKAIRKSSQLQQMGSLESRVDQIIEAEFTQGVTQTTPAQFEVQEAALADLNDPAAQEAVSAALTAYQDAVANGDQAAANTALVQLKAASSAAWEKAGEAGKQFLEGIEASTAGQIAGSVADTITLGQIDPAEFDLEESDMTELLGEGWGELTVPQLKEKVEGLRKEEFSRAFNLQKELRDPALTDARRSEIMSEMKDLGQVGISGAEAEIHDVERAITEADTVEIAGKSMNIEELLSDETVSGLVTEYLGLPEDSERKKELGEQFGGGFAQWIEEHKEGLVQLQGQMEAADKSFDELQEDNESVGDFSDILSGQELDEKILKDLFGDEFGEWTDRDYATELQAQPWYNILKEGTKGVTPNQRNKFVQTLNDAKYLDKEFAQELKDLSAGEVKKLMNDPGKFEDYVRYRSQFMKFEDLPTDKVNDTDFLLDYLFGEDVAADEILDASKKARVLGSLGLDDGKAAVYKKITDKRGNIDLDKLQTYLQDNPPVTDANSMKDYIKKPSETRFSGFEDPRAQDLPKDVAMVYDFLKDDRRPSLDKKDVAAMLDNADIFDQMSSSSQIFDFMGKQGKKLYNKHVSGLYKDMIANLPEVNLPSGVGGFEMPEGEVGQLMIPTDEELAKAAEYGMYEPEELDTAIDDIERRVNELRTLYRKFAKNDDLVTKLKIEYEDSLKEWKRLKNHRKWM